MDLYAVDLHKKYSFYVCGNGQGQVVRRGRVSNTRDELIQMVAPSRGKAKVVLESTGNWSFVYDTLEPFVEELILVHSKQVKAIAHARVKSDEIDANTLFHLLRADLIPAAYIAPREVRDRRDWLRSRTAIVRMATQLKNRIHALLAKNGLTSPVSDLFGKEGREWLARLELHPVHREILERCLRVLDTLEAEIKETNAQVLREARADARSRLLMSIPGVGPLTALLLLAEIGEVQRFQNHKKLVS
jgi:transposase